MSDCNGGIVPSLQVRNLDCNCVSISSITWNAAGTQFTITLNNGQSITSPVLTGPEGSAPTIEFRVSGTTLQYQIDDGAWVSLIDLSTLVEGKNVISNQLTNAGTNTNTWQVLGTATTDYTNNSKNLTTNGDYLELNGRFTSSVKNCNTRIRLNNSTTIGNLNYGFYGDNINTIEYTIRINRVSATSVSCVLKVIVYQNTGFNYSAQNAFASTEQTVAVSNMASNNITITAEADAQTATADEVVLEYFTNNIFKMI